MGLFVSLSSTRWLQALIVQAISLGALAVIGVAAHRARGRHRRIVVLVGASVAGVWLGDVLWWAPALISGGQLAGSPTPGDAGWALGEWIWLVVLWFALASFENRGDAALDVAVAVVGIGLFGGAFLIGPFVGSSDFTVLGKLTQSTHALFDIAASALAMRILVAGRRAPFAARVLVLATGCYVFSDVVWNWAACPAITSPGRGPTPDGTCGRGWLRRPSYTRLWPCSGSGGRRPRRA